MSILVSRYHSLMREMQETQERSRQETQKKEEKPIEIEDAEAELERVTRVLEALTKRVSAITKKVKEDKENAAKAQAEGDEHVCSQRRRKDRIDPLTGTELPKNYRNYHGTFIEEDE